MQSQSEIRQSITNRLVAALKSGTNIPWRRPWRTIGPRFPTNVSGRAYSGINILTLWLAAQERNFPVDLWGTYQQWASIGAQVKKGAKSERIVFYSPVNKRTTDEDGMDQVKTFPILKTWSVFNVSEVSGEAVEKFHDQPSATKFESPNREEFDRVVAATGADVRFGGDRAFYKRLPDDFVQMPIESQFHDFPSYAETLGHELLHWSEHRTGWAENYALSEIRAEIGACFLSANCGIPVSNDLTNHQSYLASWLEALERDERFLFRASSAASKGVDFILSFSNPQVESDVEAEAVATV